MKELLQKLGATEKEIEVLDATIDLWHKLSYLELSDLDNSECCRIIHRIQDKIAAKIVWRIINS